ncbi:MAG: DHHW family protein [Clostridia bacterium]|nr:DHHW family protein [Clostridia bacterium]
MDNRQRLIRQNYERRMRARKNRQTDVICISVAAIVFGIFVILNLFQFNRPTKSEVEKRELARFPKLTWSSLTSGDFTEGINSFFADTFVFRDNFVSLSKKLDTLKGAKGDFELIGGGGGHGDDGPSGIGDVLDNLDTEPVQTKEPEPVDPTAKIKLSKSQVKLTVGGGVAVTAEVSDGTVPTWSVDNELIISLTADGATANIKGLAEGDANLTCTAGSESAVCTVSVEKVSAGGVDNGDTADFMTNGLFIYGDAVYTSPWYIEQNSKDYGDVAEYYAKLFPDARMSVCVIPTSAIKIDNKEILSKFPDQEWVFSEMSRIVGRETVNFVDTYHPLFDHRDEYVYFRSDHHWTQRGAYYAYKAFVESIGLEATPITGFDVLTLSTEYSGSMYDYTQDERVKTFKDTVEAFMSKKKMTMTVTDRSGNVAEYDSAIMAWSETYAAFLCGDNPYTVINVPENPQDRNILVLKDSYGNAFVPFLAENFGNIMVVDTRYSDMNIKDMFADYHLTDILFVNNLEAANSPAWAKMYLKAVGVQVD